MSNSHKQLSRQQVPGRSAFVLLLVLVVLVIATLAALTFARSMLVAHEGSLISTQRFKARMCAESGLQVVRRFVALPQADRLELGGAWQNDMFYARNIIAHPTPENRGNYSIIAPALDAMGSYSGIRFGLQNESSKLNLNALSQLDALASSGDLGAAASGTGDEASITSTLTSSLASAATESMGSDMAASMLLALPGMTNDVADSILDWLDEDDEMRTYGAEFDDYYSSLPTPYRPQNGPISSIEQLLLVRGVTPQLLFGYDTDRNGILSDDESNNMTMGGGLTASSGGVASSEPAALGWAPYLTIHSMEKNVTRYGEPRININGDDLQTLYTDLQTALEDPATASFIVAYRHFGSPGGNGSSPLVTLAGMVASESDPDGAIGAQLGALEQLSGASNQQGGGQTEPWSADLLGEIDLTQTGSVKFNQVLDLIDATITIGEGDNQTVYSSPFTSDPVMLTLTMPTLMGSLTTVDAKSIPGRINIMTCPQEVLRGVPGLTDEVVDQIIEARTDGSESETRFYETWLVVESLVTMDEMRALLPLLTCGGDVFKAQIIGYMEGDGMAGRIEAVVSGVEDVPKILFFRRLDHLGRSVDIITLGQRFDATTPGGSL